MNCDRAKDLVGALRDGELSPDERREVMAHLETCKSCADETADFDRMGRALRLEGRVPTPSGLAERIQDTLNRADKARHPAAVATPVPAVLTGRRPPISGGLRQASALAAACVLSIVATWWVVSNAGDADRLQREILSAHIRSLLQDAVVQVASSDQHTVRPWFAGRVDYAPEIRDLKSEGFPLIGGRLDYIAERRVSALVYKRNLHVINVFLWPATGAPDSAPKSSVRNGYNLLSWSRSSVTYWAISDLNIAELEQLQRAL